MIYFVNEKSWATTDINRSSLIFLQFRFSFTINKYENVWLVPASSLRKMREIFLSLYYCMIGDQSRKYRWWDINITKIGYLMLKTYLSYIFTRLDLLASVFFFSFKTLEVITIHPVVFSNLKFIQPVSKPLFLVPIICLHGQWLLKNKFLSSKVNWLRTFFVFSWLWKKVFEVTTFATSKTVT